MKQPPHQLTVCPQVLKGLVLFQPERYFKCASVVMENCLFKYKPLTVDILRCKNPSFMVQLSCTYFITCKLSSVLQMSPPLESYGDGSKGSSFRRKHQDTSDSAHSIPSTPDRYCTALAWPIDEWYDYGKQQGCYLKQGKKCF